MSLKLNSSGGGSITLQEPSTASNRTLTLPDNTGNLISSADSGTVSQTMLASGVAGTGPAVMAEANADQSITSDVFTKVTLQNEIFDTDNCFTNSRFTPNVSGYYQVNGLIKGNNGTNNLTALISAIYKNGSVYAMSILYGSGQINAFVSAVVYMNGTTDYLELYGYLQGASPYFDYSNAGNTSQFSAALVRAA